MSISCGNCHSKHATVADVRACYGRGDGRDVATLPAPPQPVGNVRIPAWAMDPATPRQLDYLRSLLDMKDWGKAPFQGTVDETFMNVIDGKTIGKKEASDAIEALRRLPNKLPEGGDPSVAVEAATVPEGRYALVGDDGVVAFYKVDRPTEGKWAGRVFVKLIVGGVGHWQEYRRKVADILPKIEAMGARESAALFGLKVRHCGRCMSPLSQLQSRAAGYGEHCAGLLGWPYPSKAEARAILLERGESLEEADRQAEQEYREQHEALAASQDGVSYTGDEHWWDHGNQS